MKEQKKCDGLIHVVKKGDTLYKISKMHNVKVGDIISANPYVNIYNLTIGDELCIPVIDLVCVTDYEPVEGDTVGTLCSRFGLPLHELFDHNDKLYDMEIKPGTVLDISGGTCEK